MLHEDENSMDLVPPGQPENENADPPDVDHIDPVQAERERLQAKVKSYIEAVFTHRRMTNIAPVGGALWAATFNAQPAPLRGTRQKISGATVTLSWLYDQLINYQITTKHMGDKMVATLIESTDEQKEFYLRYLEAEEEEGK